MSGLTHECFPFDAPVTCVCDQYSRILQCNNSNESEAGKDGGITETVLAVTLLVAVILIFVSYALHRFEKLFLSKDFQIPVLIWCENFWKRFRRRWKTTSQTSQTDYTCTEGQHNYTLIGITSINQEINHHLHINQEKNQEFNNQLHIKENLQPAFESVHTRVSLENEALYFQDGVKATRQFQNGGVTMQPYRHQDAAFYPTLPLREPLHVNIPSENEQYPLLSLKNENLYPTLPLRKGTLPWNNETLYPVISAGRDNIYPEMFEIKKPLYPELPQDKVYQTLPNPRRQHPPKPPVRKETLYVKLPTKVDDLPLKKNPLYPPIAPKPSKKVLELKEIQNFHLSQDISSPLQEVSLAGVMELAPPAFSSKIYSQNHLEIHKNNHQENLSNNPHTIQEFTQNSYEGDCEQEYGDTGFYKKERSEDSEHLLEETNESCSSSSPEKQKSCSTSSPENQESSVEHDRSDCVEYFMNKSLHSFDNFP